VNSRFYRGTVWHARGEPKYVFRYSVWYLCLDLAERGEVAKKLWPFSLNRHNLTSLWEKDYAVLQDEGWRAEPGERVELLTMPRFLNYVFNPVSFLLRRAEDGVVMGVTAEVHNTWGERHLYVLDREGDGDEYRSSIDKAFYVSPFLGPEARYEFKLSEAEEDERERLQIEIGEHDAAGEWTFSAGIDVRPLAVTNANLARLLLTMPFMNLKTIAAIHWQGLKIWLRGEKFRPNPSRMRRKERADAG
jgi:DUF1365 family protein